MIIVYGHESVLFQSNSWSIACYV